ncbi:MAG: NUDIX domain-containing protein [Burkholderiales bacterium]
MTQRTSAGLLLYRRNREGLDVFLVHPGGPYWARKDAGAWSIPKGECAQGEDLLQAARREFAEETGVAVDGDFRELAPVRLRSGKVVHAWALERDLSLAGLASNTFDIEWPPRSGRMQSFPEVDRYAWFQLGEARARINEGQRSLLDALEALLR